MGNKRIVGVVMYDPRVIPKALDFVQRTRDKYPLGKVVSRKFPLDKINGAFKQAEWLNRQTDVGSPAPPLRWDREVCQFLFSARLIGHRLV